SADVSGESCRCGHPTSAMTPSRARTRTTPSSTRGTVPNLLVRGVTRAEVTGPHSDRPYGGGGASARSANHAVQSDPVHQRQTLVSPSGSGYHPGRESSDRGAARAGGVGAAGGADTATA